MKKLLFVIALVSSASLFASHKHHVSKPVQITHESRLSPLLDCLEINNPADLTGYNFYQNVSFDPQIAVNPTNPKNIVIVAQQDALANAVYNASFPIATIVLFTVNGGITWNQSHLVMSRCQGKTGYKANDNFFSAYFPTVSFDKEGVCYILSSSYNLFQGDHNTTLNVSEGNIIAKSKDGGISWDQVTAAFRDEGICHYLDFPFLKANPYHPQKAYIVSSDNTCLVSDTCINDPHFTGNQNIVFQKTLDGGISWTPLLTIASYVPDTGSCTPIPMWHQLEVLPTKHRTLLVSSMIQHSNADTVDAAPMDEIIVYRSHDDGATWTEYPVTQVPHVLVVDPDSVDPILPVTDFTTKDMAVNPKNGYAYMVYSDPQFNPTGQAGIVIIKSKDGGKTWSTPRPINPLALDSQAFLPTVAVAKDGTVGVLFYDLRHFVPGDDVLSADVWMSFFDEELHHYHGQVRLTPQSFDVRKTIRGYNGVDLGNCQFDYYLSNHVGLTTIENDFVATFPVTNEACQTAMIGSFPCDAFPLSIDTCKRLNLQFVRIKRDH